MTLPIQAMTSKGDAYVRCTRAGSIPIVGLAVTSCGDSSTEPEDSLTGEEALALVWVAMRHSLQVTDDTLPGGGPDVPGDARCPP